MNIVCSGCIVRYPLGGQTWHHLQYLLGFQQLGHRVTYVETYGWPDSCYNPALATMTSDPAYGIAYLNRQDTAFETVLPCGRGLLAFATPAEAAEAIAQVRSDYAAHCSAARAIAADFFDARSVLGKLLETSVAEYRR